MQDLSAIQSYQLEDAPSLAALYNALYPEHPTHPEDIVRRDERYREPYKMRRFVVWDKGKVVGAAEFKHGLFTFHPQTFAVYIEVHPEYQRRGLGKRLFEHLFEALRPLKPLTLRTKVREPEEMALAFFEARGFSEETRDWSSRLELGSLKLKPTPLPDGVRLLNLLELRQRPDYVHDLYTLSEALVSDVPLPEPKTAVPLEVWRQTTLDDPRLIPEAFLVAEADGRYIGMHDLKRISADDTGLAVGLTGVARAYRRQGIARALKQANLSWAKAQGYTYVKTWNSAENRAMLAINEALGFQKDPAWITLRRDFEETA